MKLVLAHAAAQLFTVGFQGQVITPELKELLKRGVGGVILFSRNIGEPKEIASLIAEIKRLAGRPLLVTVDQEGGRVARLKQGFTPLPSMRAVGLKANPALAMQLGQLIGRELGVVGFDLTYSPVLDVDTNPENPVIGTRSFGRSAEIVSQMGVALMQGLAQSGVAACGKHFPGHGDTAQDSHLELPRLPHAMGRLERVELPPFAAAIQAGIPAIMTAHVIFEPLDSTYPATLSVPVLQGLLRERMGYSGVVYSDDIEMKAIADHYGLEETVILGVNAGVDQFLCCHTAATAQSAVDIVIQAVENRDILWERVVAANQRFTLLTSKFARPAQTQVDVSGLRLPEHLSVVEQILSQVGEAEVLGEDPTEILERIRQARLRPRV